MSTRLLVGLMIWQISPLTFSYDVLFSESFFGIIGKLVWFPKQRRSGRHRRIPRVADHQPNLWIKSPGTRFEILTISNKELTKNNFSFLPSPSFRQKIFFSVVVERCCCGKPCLWKPGWAWRRRRKKRFRWTWTMVVRSFGWIFRWRVTK